MNCKSHSVLPVARLVVRACGWLAPALCTLFLLVTQDARTPALSASTLLLPAQAGRTNDAPLPAGEVLQWGQEPVQGLSSTRGRQVLNGLWRFRPAEGAVEPQAQWGFIRVPGAWACGPGRKIPGIVAAGAGGPWTADLSQLKQAWYERPIALPAAWAGRELLLHLDRVSTAAEVYVNDRRVGQVGWPGGDVVLTSSVPLGTQATLRILVTASEEGLPRASEFAGRQRRPTLQTRGIIGDVWLESRPRGPRIDGVSIRTSVRKKEFALDVELAGAPPAGEVRFSATVADGQGRLARTFAAVRAVSKDTQTVSLAWPWGDPELWDFLQPNLYTLRLRADGAGIHDELTERFGFRETWISGREIFLNGKPFRLRPVVIPDTSGTVAPQREIIDGMIRGFLRNNYNLQEMWPRDLDIHGSINDRKWWAMRADELGWPLISSITSQSGVLRTWREPGVKERWEQQVIAEWKRLRNHPSILMFTSTPNAFGHGDEESPVRIGNSKTGPDLTPTYVENARRGFEGLDIIRKYEKTRPVTNHSNVTVGDIYSTNLYLNMIPLQEREEWLSEWAKTGDMPFLASEFGLPLFYTGLRGRSAFNVTATTEPLYTEAVAIYFGTKAYEWETEEYRRDVAALHVEGDRYLSPQTRVWYHDLDRGWLELQRLFTKYTWRSYRTWGLTGGLIPWAPNGPESVWWEGPRKQVPPPEPGRLGFYFAEVPALLLEGKPVVWKQNALRMDALREGNAPTLAYIGGYPAFTSKDHQFFAGSRASKQVVLINDRREDLAYGCEWTVRLGGQTIASGSLSGHIAAGTNRLLPIEFAVPAVGQKTDGEIRLSAVIGPDRQEDVFEFRDFPAPRGNRAGTLLIFDPEGETRKLVRAVGWNVETWNGRPQPGQVLVIGRHALTIGRPLPGPLKNFVAAGGRAVVFGQPPERLRAAGFRVARHVSRQFFRVQTDHPILRGLDESDLRNWAGGGSLVPETENIYTSYPTYYPRWGWHWGNRGSVSSAAIEKPHHSGWTPVLEGEWDLAYSPLMELAYGQGLLLLCTLDLEGRQDTDPVAALLAGRILSYAQTARLQPRATRTVYLGGGQDRALLDSLGLIYEPADALPGSGALAILGRDAAVPEPAITRFLESGGRLLCLPRAPGSLPFGFVAETRLYRSETRVPAWIEARGLSVSDLHLRTDVQAPVIVSGPGEIGAGGLLARVARGGGVALLLQLTPDRLDTARRPYLTYSAWRLTRTLVQLLTNLGGAFRMDDASVDLETLPDFSSLAGVWRVQPDPDNTGLASGFAGPGLRDLDLPLAHVPSEMPSPRGAWFRREVLIPDRWDRTDLIVRLGGTDDVGSVYFAGQPVTAHVRGGFLVPAALVHAGHRILAVHGSVGFGRGPQQDWRIYPAGGAGSESLGYYVPGFRDELIIGDDPYRYHQW